MLQPRDFPLQAPMLVASAGNAGFASRSNMAGGETPSGSAKYFEYCKFGRRRPHYRSAALEDIYRYLGMTFTMGLVSLVIMSGTWTWC